MGVAIPIKTCDFLLPRELPEGSSSVPLFGGSSHLVSADYMGLNIHILIYVIQYIYIYKYRNIYKHKSYKWDKRRIGDFDSQRTARSNLTGSFEGSSGAPKVRLFPSQLLSTLANGIGIAMNRHADGSAERRWHFTNVQDVQGGDSGDSELSMQNGGKMRFSMKNWRNRGDLTSKS